MFRVVALSTENRRLKELVRLADAPDGLMDALGGLIATYETSDHADQPCGTCAICAAEKSIAAYQQKRQERSDG